ncbi:hypothetical protein DCC62_32270 [candidate division KSB1 bacterium]|nr:MAG: hypothetical protein DCC62_32270 [candidate division KSB1 bacterium]
MRLKSQSIRSIPNGGHDSGLNYKPIQDYNVKSNSVAQTNSPKGAKCRSKGQRPGKSLIMRYHQAPTGRHRTTSGMPPLQG